MTGLTLSWAKQRFIAPDPLLYAFRLTGAFCIQAVHVLSYLNPITLALKDFLSWLLYYSGGTELCENFTTRSNRRSTWCGTSRLLFHVSRLRRGKFALHDDTSDRADSSSPWALRAWPWSSSFSLFTYLSLIVSIRAKTLKIDAL